MGFLYFILVLMFLLVIAYGYYKLGYKKTKKKEKKKEKKESKLDKELFKIAQKQGGKLTISDVVAKGKLDEESAEQMLDEMTKQGTVDMQITDEGEILYVFLDMEVDDKEKKSKKKKKKDKKTGRVYQEVE